MENENENKEELSTKRKFAAAVTAGVVVVVIGIAADRFGKLASEKIQNKIAPKKPNQETAE
jgi:hypothetical protein